MALEQVVSGVGGTGRRACAMLLLFTSAALAAAQAGPTSAAELDARVRAAVTDPAFTRLAAPPGLRAHGGQYLRLYDLPPAVMNVPGVVATPFDSSASIWTDGTVLTVSATSIIRLGGPPAAQPDATWPVAEAYARRVCPGFWADGTGERQVTHRSTRLRPGESCYWIEWERRDGLLHTGDLKVAVRPWDLRVVSLECADRSSVVAALRKQPVSLTRAVELALAAKPLGKPAVSPRCAEVVPSDGCYRVVLVATDRETGEPRRATVRVDARTGELGKLVWRAPEQREEHTLPLGGVVSSRLPCWTKSGLVFVSNLAIAGVPWCERIPDQCFLRSEDGGLAALTCDAMAGVRDCRSPTGGGWVAITRELFTARYEWTTVLDLRTGDLALAGRPDLPCPEATVSPDGEWAVGVTSAVGTPDLQAVPLDFQRFRLGLRGRVVGPGDESAPCLSADGRWLYFGETERGQHFLSRVAAADACRAELLKRQQLAVERLAVMPAMVERITEAGGPLVCTTVITVRGRESVVRHWQVSPDDRQVRALDLAGLRDDEAGATITQVGDVIAGPTAQDITFAGEVRTPQGTSSRLFQRRLDGGRVAALTPVHDVTVPPYTFPGSGRTVAEVVSRWVAGEQANAPDAIKLRQTGR